jgi:hypothetical protein
MLIQLMVLYAMWMWAEFPTFHKCSLLQFLGLKGVEWVSISVYVDEYFEGTTRGKNVGWCPARECCER